MSRVSEYERQKILELADLLLSAFVWSDTHQGNAYWHDVYKNLKLLAKCKERRVIECRRINNERRRK